MRSVGAATPLEAVRQLAEPHGIDADELYRRTAGNPFFLSEALASGDGEIPPTVRDAVLARMARLSTKAASLLGAVAIVQPHAELWRLEALATEDELACLEECLSSGMLTPTTDGVAFRHELSRMTIEDTLAPYRSAVLHRDALAALVEPPGGAPDPARLAHHAEAAGDAAAVLEFAPAAAARAEAVGAHRQAAVQYARALRYADDLPPERRVALLDGRFRSAFRADDCDEAIDAMQDALRCHRALGDRQAEGDRMRRLSGVLSCPGNRWEDAERMGQGAVTVLEGLGPGRELGLAYANIASLCMNREEADGTVAWAARALELADRLDDVEVRVHVCSPPWARWSSSRATWQYVEPVAAARAEAAWLRGDRNGVAQATQATLDLAVELDAGGVVGELALWRRRAGISEEIAADVAEPYAPALAGDWKAAAAQWAIIGRPHDHVGAILRKLGVHTRGEAGSAARRLGLAPDDD